MTAFYSAPGDMIDYTPVADVVAGQAVKIGSGATARLAVAPVAIPANTKGSVRTKGLFRLPHSLGAFIPTTLGAELDFNFTTQLVVPAGTGDANVSVYVIEPTADATGEAEYSINGY